MTEEISLGNIQLNTYLQCRKIIKQCNKSKTPVFVATNLLESMINEISPTRAEVNDVYTTLKCGADGLVLAAETAVGKNPISCASMIKKPSMFLKKVMKYLIVRKIKIILHHY